MQTSLRVLLVTNRPEDLPRHVTHVIRLKDCRVVAAGGRADILPKLVARDFRSAVASTVESAGSRTPRRVRRLENLRYGRQECLRYQGQGKALVRLRKVTVRYGAATILRGIDWTVRAGESWALLGPNGSGKTTLLSLILGDNPQAYVNEVEVFGRRRGSGESIWEIKQHIGWVSPELHLHFNDAATCLEVVASGFRNMVGLFELPTPRQRRAARKQLAQFGMLAAAETPLFALSAGLQRMVLLARALVKQPRLLILDEPCQGLDPAHRALFIRTVDALLRKPAVTAIYVTHRLDEIPPSIQRVLRL